MSLKIFGFKIQIKTCQIPNPTKSLQDKRTVYHWDIWVPLNRTPTSISSYQHVIIDFKVKLLESSDMDDEAHIRNPKNSFPVLKL